MPRGRRWRLIGLGLLWTLAAPTPALAGDVYVNGVRITGRTELELRKVNVRIDARGDVHVDAPGYRVVPGQAAAEAAPTRYYLVTTASERRLQGFALDVFVNGRKVARLRSDEAQVTQALSRWLAPGANEVLLVVRRDPDASRRPQPERFLRVVMGEAEVGGASVVVSRPLLDWRLTADAVDGDVRTFRIEVD